MKRKDVLKLSDLELDEKVKIQGTQFDRKRKLTDRQVSNIKRLLIKGKSLKYLADKYNVDIRTIRYNIDQRYKAYIQCYQAVNFGEHTGQDNITTLDRINYKRMLIRRRKIKTKDMM